MISLIKYYWKHLAFGCVAFIILFLMVAWHIVSDIREKKKFNCFERRHKWRGKGSFGCYCQYCEITLKEFIKRGGTND